eukprot:5319752-Ditylum_brightwellii.AAC.1
MKDNPVISHHLEQFNIFVNDMHITEIVKEKAGFYLYSHHKFTSHDSAHYEMNSCLQAQNNLSGGFDLGAQMVCVSKRNKLFEAKAIVHTLGREQCCLQKSVLYRITSKRDRQRLTQTGSWRFIPFSPDGKFTIDQIIACIKAQNNCIGSVDNMSVTGFLDINAYVTNPKDGCVAPFRHCLLQDKAADGEPLIVSIEDGQPGVMYFVVKKHHKEEVEKLLDNVEVIYLNKHYSFDDDMSMVVNGDGVQRRNWSEPTENNGYAAAAIADLINKQYHKAMLIDLTKDDVNDSVKNAWKDPPRTVYSAKNVIPVDDDVQQSIHKMDKKALSDMMSHVKKRAREVCAPDLAAMKQRQEVLERKLAEKN